MKFPKHVTAGAVVAASLTLQCTLTVQPLDSVISSQAANVGTGLTKLEILLMTPLWRDASLRFTVDVIPQQVIPREP